MSYTSLENALELAAYRLPSGILGLLIAQAEEVIEKRADGTRLERKIHGMVNEYVTGNSLFSLDKLKAANDGNGAAAEVA